MTDHRPKMYMLDDNHEPVAVDVADHESYAAWIKSMEGTRSVASTEVVDRIRHEAYHISTVFLGIDHSFGEGNIPVLFETMVFGGKHDGHQDRYTNYEAARAGHDRVVHMVRESCKRDRIRWHILNVVQAILATFVSLFVAVAVHTDKGPVWAIVVTWLGLVALYGTVIKPLWHRYFGD